MLRLAVFVVVPEFGFLGTPRSNTFTGSETSGEVVVTIGILNGVMAREVLTILLVAKINVADDNPAHNGKDLC